jgi:hypothetical protein
VRLSCSVSREMALKPAKITRPASRSHQLRKICQRGLASAGIMARRLQLIWLVLALSTKLLVAVDHGIEALSVSAQDQARIAELIQNALGPYRDRSWTSGAAIEASAVLTNIEANFRRASDLMPNRLDLRFGIASALLGQALQTNSPFELKVTAALRVYQEIEALDPRGFEAPLLYAAYSRAIHETNASEAALNRLAVNYSERARAYLEKFRRVDEILQREFNDQPQGTMPTNSCHAIAVLGAALETNGTIKGKLVGRLERALILATLYPDAPIILTGGNQRNGITEAYAMRSWLLNGGVCDNRIHLEDQARDTVGNAIYSTRLLKELGVTHVTLVTGVSHLPRALADFEEAGRETGLWLEYSNLVSTGEPELDPERERLAIYRDVIRTSGIWAFPGIQR